MTPEEREMLKKALELSEENNRMLRSIKRSMFWAKVVRIVYWVIILGAAIGIFYYIQPYLNDIINAYGNVKGNIQNFGNFLK